MAQPRLRHEEENFLIVGNLSWFPPGIDFLFTLFFWGYSLLVVVFFLSAAFDFNIGCIIKKCLAALNGVATLLLSVHQSLRH